MTDNILVIKLGALGDFIQALGPMKAIRNHHPQSKITLLTTKPFENLAKQSGYFDSVWLDERPKIHQPAKWLKLRKTLNAEQFSRVYDLQNNDRTGFYFWLFSPKPEWVGVAKGASHRNVSAERTSGLAFYGHKQTLGLAGIDNIEIDPLDWLKSDNKNFDLSAPYALIIPGSAPTRPEKRWSAENYIHVCKKLLEQNIQPVILGTESEKEITSKISGTCKKALDLTEKTSLFDIPPLARKAEFALGNDTGPMHMIAPTGCHTIVLFSKHSNPVRHAPLGKNVITIQQENLGNLKPEEVLQQISQIASPASQEKVSAAP